VEFHRNRELLRTELLYLIEKQVGALKEKPLRDFTNQQRREYDNRQTRIHDLLIELHYEDPAV
jgi:hypothetical protein